MRIQSSPLIIISHALQKILRSHIVRMLNLLTMPFRFEAKILDRVVTGYG